MTRPVDAKKLARRPFYRAERKRGKDTVSTIVSVPETDTAPNVAPEKEAGSTTRHTEIQHALLTLGYEMGFEVWVARNDRSRTWQSVTLGGLEGMVEELPTSLTKLPTGPLS